MCNNAIYNNYLDEKILENQIIFKQKNSNKNIS